MSVRTLHSFFGNKRKATDDASDCDRAKDESSPASKRQRLNFNPAWKQTIPWLEKIESDRQIRATCYVAFAVFLDELGAMAKAGSPNIEKLDVHATRAVKRTSDGRRSKGKAHNCYQSSAHIHNERTGILRRIKRKRHNSGT